MWLRLSYFRAVPESYAVLFLQGGATAQFSAIPLNFLSLNSSQTADYLVTGYWSEKAAKEAEKFGKVNWVVPKESKYQGKDKNTIFKCIFTLVSSRCSPRNYMETHRKSCLFLLLCQ